MLRDVIKPIHIIIASALVLGLVLFFVFTKVYEAANPIIIKKVPSDAKLFVDDKEVSGGRTNLANGTYTIRAEKDGFTTETTTTLITDDSKFIAISLTPSSDAAKKWASENEQQYLDLEQFVGSASVNSGKTLAEKNPIVTALPITGPTYSVGYTVNQNDSSRTSITLTVHALEGYRNTAIHSIYTAGYNPADYTISFSDFTNPFAEASK